MSQMWEPNNAEEIVAIMAAIPGDTNADKLAWVQAAVARATKHLVGHRDWTIPNDVPLLTDDLAPSPCPCGGNCDKGADFAVSAQSSDAAAKAMSKALGEIEAALLENVKAGDAGYVIEKIAKIVDGVE